MRGVTAYTVGVLVAYIVGSVIGTQMILYSVSTMALEVTLNARLGSTVNDLVGLSASLLPMMAVSLVIPWLVCDFVTRRHPHLRSPLLYGLTAAFAIAILHIALSQIFGMDVFAPARTLAGLLGQCLAGAIGGVCLNALR
jgi:small-conductance mechanosensitive channel